MITTNYEYSSYKRLAQSILLQAIKDYAHGPKRDLELSKFLKISVKKWVKNKSGTFELCADAMNMSPDKLQKMMIDKMKAIDEGEQLKIYTKKRKR